MILNTSYKTIRTVVEEHNILTGKVKMISEIDNTKLTDIVKDLVDLSSDQEKLARKIRRLRQKAIPLNEIITLIVEGDA
jgi:3-methyladenine DNA glycosylase/8-oxoguanine DNA glycosylase